MSIDDTSNNNKSKAEINKDYYEKHKPEISAQRKAKAELIKSLLAKKESQPIVNNNPSDKNPSSQTTNGSDNNDKIKILDVDPSEYVIALNEKYIERNGEKKEAERHMKLDRSLAIVGDSGIGKSLFVKSIASENKIPIVKVQCHDKMTDKEMFGTTQLKNGESIFVLGFLPTGIELANKSPNKKAIILLDEVNCLDSATQKILNESLNFRHGIVVPKLNKQYKLNSDSQILVIATMNPSHYLGTNEINAELKSRFNWRKWDDLTDDQTHKLLKVYKLESDLIEKLIHFKNQVKSAHQSQTLDHPIDTREIVKFCVFYSDMVKDMSHDEALKEALTLCLAGKYLASANEDHVRLIREMIESSFAVKI